MSIWEIVATLAAQGVILNKGAVQAQIAAAEETLDFKFPLEFTQFYLLANGFDGTGCMTNGLFSIWSLEQIQQE